MLNAIIIAKFKMVEAVGVMGSWGRLPIINLSSQVVSISVM